MEWILTIIFAVTLLCGLNGLRIVISLVSIPRLHRDPTPDFNRLYPGPNYREIADMERDLFGKTWHNMDVAPGYHCHCDLCEYVDPHMPIGPWLPMVVPPKPPAADWHDWEG